jgi:hypothetical protein
MGEETGRRVTCAACGQVLAQGVGVPVPDAPCPNCGASTRNIALDLGAEVKVTSRMIGHRAGSTGSPEGEAVRVAGPGERAAAADFETNDSVSYEIAGPAPQGEEGALETTQLLVQRLRASGENWDDPVKVDEQDVDCEAWSGNRVLRVQVTRVPHTPLWQRLGTLGTVSGGGTADQAADELMDAIAAKARRLPDVQRARLVVALDARDTPAFALAGVVSDFRQRHGQQAIALGFGAVWVVGPVVDLVARLDQ